MRLEHTDVIDAPIDVVYALIRDELPAIAEYLPNVAKVETLSRQTVRGKEHIVNHWYADVDAPAVLTRFVSPQFFSWADKAKWDAKKQCVDYELESFFANDLFVAKGQNKFTAKGNKTELHLVCDMEIKAENVPGIPQFMVRRILPVVESLIKKMLEPNLTSLGKGLKAYLAESPLPAEGDK